jgi:trans-aconitate methyltransferase
MDTRLDFDGIRRYWDDRAAGDTSVQSTTQDVYLREIEFRVLSERIAQLRPASVADVGCGDGRTTTRLAAELPGVAFHGYDYAGAMVANARGHAMTGPAPQVRFTQCDVTQGLPGRFDLIFTTRCLINLPTWELQMTALRHIHAALHEGGSYLMVENFLEGHDNFNQVRSRYGLDPIAVRPHNFFLQRERLLAFSGTLFDLQEELNISSTYYLMSRVVYARMCADQDVAPDYFDDHHRLAAGLPFAGEFGPVRLLSLRKRPEAST